MEELNGDYTHAENLNLFIEKVLHKANLTLASLDAISISKGPGSYTGLRIGVSTAKGLCFSLNKPLIAINTLEHSAYACSQKHGDAHTLFCPMIDARRMEVYCAIFDKENKELISPTAASIIDGIHLKCCFKNKKFIFLEMVPEKCKTSLATQSNAIFIDQLFPSAKNMIQLYQSFSKQAV